MTPTHRLAVLAAALALTTAGALVAAPQQPGRASDQQTQDLLTRMAARIDTFRTSFDRAIDRHPINGTRAEGDLNQSVSHFKEAADRLRDRVNDRRATDADVQDVLRPASAIDSFMANYELETTAERDWLILRDDLDQVASAYRIAWPWTGSLNQQASLPPRDRQIGQLLSRIGRDAERFRQSLELMLDRNRFDDSQEEDDINQLVTDFVAATNRLQDRFDRRLVVTSDVEDVLGRAVSIDRFVQRRQLANPAGSGWLAVSRDLDELAGTYGVVWNGSASRDTTDGPGRELNQRLTGTYQRDDSRGDDSERAVDQATRTLPSDQRQGASQRLIGRLNAPDTFSIDRNGSRVTVASSHGPEVTFEADGRNRTEQGLDGQTVTTRATLSGDQLAVTSTGTGGNDFAVTLEPIDGDSGLLVTRRIYDDALREPVTVRSYYRKSSNEPQWNLYSPAPEALSWPALPAGIPAGTRIVATLDSALSTRTAHAEDRFTLTTRGPSPYDGAVIEGTISGVNASGRVSGRADMGLEFASIRLQNGRTYPFAGVIESVRTPDGETVSVDSAGTVEDASQTEKTVERGAIGAVLGAIIGAIAGGGQGAVVGGVVGAGAGAGTVIAQGRDQMDLARGTEFTIRASMLPAASLDRPTGFAMPTYGAVLAD